MTFRFGKLPGKIPVGLRDLTFYASGALPKAPASVAVPAVTASSDGTPWGVLGNDTKGDCGVAGIDHGFMCDASIAGIAEQFPSADDVVSYYLAYTGGQDSGVVLSDFLAYVRKNQFYGHTIAGYAPIAVQDVPTLNFVVDAYGFAYTGITVSAAMMEAFREGKPWTLAEVLSEPVGGHCIPICGYDSDYLYAVTWGKVQPVSYSAWHYIGDEAWAVIPGEFVSRGGDMRGVSLDALNADLSKLGGLSQ